MKVLVCGGRKFANKGLLHQTLLGLHNRHQIDMIIHGGATGADEMAGRFARWAGLQEVICPANWDVHGTSAGYKRNEAMSLLCPDLVVAFPGGVGTEMMVKISRHKYFQVMEVQDEEGETHLG